MVTIPLNRPRRRGEWQRALVVVGALLVLVFLGSWWSRPLGRLSLALSSPFLHLGQGLGNVLEQASSALRFKQALLADNLRLQSDLVALRAQVADHEALEADNRQLRQELDLLPSESAVVVAENLSHPWNAPFDLILAAIGPDQKIPLGAPVTFQKKVLAGAVVNVSDSLVKIKLLSAPDEQVPVLIGSNNIAALAQGKGSGNLEVKLPRNLNVSEGDLVMTGSSTVPLVVGTVGGVENDPGESLQTILIHTPIDLSFVRYLEIHVH